MDQLTEYINTIQNLEVKISYAQWKVDTQISIKKNAEEEIVMLEERQSEIKSEIDRIIIKISDSIWLKLQNESLKKKIKSELSKVIEGDFETNSIDSWINQIWIENANKVDEAFSQVIILSIIFYVFIK